jgi:hypothetical protein
MTTSLRLAALGSSLHPSSRRHSATAVFSLLYSSGLALTAFGAVYQPSFLGYLAASPGVLLMAISLLMLLLLRRQRNAVAIDNRRLIAWGLLVSALSILVFGLNLTYFAKTFTLLILSMIWLSPLICITRLRKRHLINAITAMLVICGIGYLLGDVFRGILPSAVNSVIFGGEYASYEMLRPRAFTQENSHFANMVGRSLVAIFLLYELNRRYSAWRLAGFIALLTLLLVSLDSKGAAISVMAAAVVLGMTRKLLLAFILMLPLFSLLILRQVDVVLIDIENFTSVSTRVTLFLSTLVGVLINPLGYGYYGFYGAIQTFGGWSIVWLDERMPLMLTEVVEIVEELKNVSTKSTLMDFTLIFGGPFIFMLWRLVRRCDLADPRVTVAFVYAFLSAMSTSGHESISFFLILAILVRWYPRRLNDCRRQMVPAQPQAQIALQTPRQA